MAAWLTFRSLLRTRWAVWLALALFVGVTAGGVMAGLAGARRTASAYDRFLDHHRAYNVLIALDCPGNIEVDTGAPGTSCVDEVAELPSVADVTSVALLAAHITNDAGRSLQPKFQPQQSDPCYAGPGQVFMVGDRTGRFGAELNEVRIVAGRRADPTAADEVVVSKAIADRVGLAPGAMLRASLFPRGDCQADRATWGRPLPLRVVGIGLAPGEVPPASGGHFGFVHVTPAFLATRPPRFDQVAVAVRLRDGIGADALLADVDRMGGRAEVFDDLDDRGVAVERGIRPQAVALGVVAGLVALAGACILAQLLVRQSDADTADRRTLAALGMSRRGQFVSAMLPAISLALIAAFTAVVSAVAVSPLTPVGLAGEIEPDPGLSFDGTVVGVGIVATVLFVVIVVAVAAWRRSRTSSVRKDAARSRSAAAGSGMASVGFPPTVVSGVQMALDRRRDRGAVPVITSVAAMAVAILAIVSSLTFGAGLAHLLDTPRLTGVNWDTFLGYPTTIDPDRGEVRIEPARIEAALADHPGIESFAAGTFFSPFPREFVQLGPERRPVAMLSFAGNSEVGPSVIRGRAPKAPDEILLGPETLDDVGLALGDTVEVYGRAGTWDKPGAETSMRARIVGIGVIPAAGGDTRLGRGATLTLDGVTRLNPEAEAAGYWLRLTDEADANRTVQELLDTLGVRRSADSSFDLAQAGSLLGVGVRELDQVDRVPQFLAVVMGAMLLGVTMHVMVSSLRTHRRDLAVMRALGFRRRDVGRAVAWQSIVYALVALAVGLPLGVVAGRLAWRAFAQRLGLVPEPVAPWPLLGIIAAGTLVMASVVGLALGRRTTSVSPATAIRTE